jgi:hypothetical protein
LLHAKCSIYIQDANAGIQLRGHASTAVRSSDLLRHDRLVALDNNSIKEVAVDELRK